MSQSCVAWFAQPPPGYSLTALPEDLRKRYVAQLRLLLPATCPIFLLTIEDAAEHTSLQQALGVDPELQTLYAADFDIDLTPVESLFEADPGGPRKGSA